MKVYGKNGVALEDDWGSEPTAYLGMTRPNFPNFFMTYGPNTNVSSGGSIIWCAETDECFFKMKLISFTLLSLSVISTSTSAKER